MSSVCFGPEAYCRTKSKSPPINSRIFLNWIGAEVRARRCSYGTENITNWFPTFSAREWWGTGLRRGTEYSASDGVGEGGSECDSGTSKSKPPPCRRRRDKGGAPGD